MLEVLAQAVVVDVAGGHTLVVVLEVVLLVVVEMVLLVVGEVLVLVVGEVLVWLAFLLV